MRSGQRKRKESKRRELVNIFIINVLPESERARANADWPMRRRVRVPGPCEVAGENGFPGDDSVWFYASEAYN